MFSTDGITENAAHQTLTYIAQAAAWNAEKRRADVGKMVDRLKKAVDDPNTDLLYHVEACRNMERDAARARVYETVGKIAQAPNKTALERLRALVDWTAKQCMNADDERNPLVTEVWQYVARELVQNLNTARRNSSEG